MAKVFKNGNSQAITLNRYELEQAGLKIGDELQVEIENKQIIFKKKEDLRQAIHDYYDNGGYYDEEEVDFGDAAGEEIW